MLLARVFLLSGSVFVLLYIAFHGSPCICQESCDDYNLEDDYDDLKFFGGYCRGAGVTAGKLRNERLLTVRNPFVNGERNGETTCLMFSPTLTDALCRRTN